MNNLRAVAVEIWGAKALQYTEEEIRQALGMAQVVEPQTVERAIDRVNLRALGGGRVQ
jgi:hypothetical protein